MIKTKFYCLIFFLMISVPLFSKSALGRNGFWGEDSHIHDQMLVLGLLNNDSKKHIDLTNKNYTLIGGVLNQFNYWIDDNTAESDNSQFYYMLKQKYNNYKNLDVDFSLHKYTHRLMFHWGYDWGDPVGHKALKKAFFNLNSLDEIKLTTEQEKIFDAFLDDVKKEQKEREATMTKTVDKFFNLNGASGLSHSIGALIYYTHLIGDHIVSANSYTEEAVLSTEQIMIKIEKEIERLVGNETLRMKVSAELKTFNQKWKELKNSGENGSVLAQDVINVLSKYLPPIIEKLWGNTFKKTGLEFVYRH